TFGEVFDFADTSRVQAFEPLVLIDVQQNADCTLEARDENRLFSGLFEVLPGVVLKFSGRNFRQNPDLGAPPKLANLATLSKSGEHDAAGDVDGLAGQVPAFWPYQKSHHGGD